MMDPVYIAKISEAHSLSSSMIEALRTGENGEPVKADTRTARALFDRELIDSENGTLTSLGLLVLFALDGNDLTAEQEAVVLPPREDRRGVRAPKLFKVIEVMGGRVIVPADGDGVILPAAKKQLKDWAHNLIRDTNALTQKAVIDTYTARQEVAQSEVDYAESETEYHADGVDTEPTL